MPRNPTRLCHLLGEPLFFMVPPEFRVLPVPSDLSAQAVDRSVQDSVARDLSLLIVADLPQDFLDFFD
jgi:hypothetical protein